MTIGIEEEGIVVLSLFDGMSCGQIALERAGIKVKQYYASEIEKSPIKTTKKNYPNTIHVGDVRNLDVSKLPRIDALIGGSPCTDFSFAGKRKGMVTVRQIRSKESYKEEYEAYIANEENVSMELEEYAQWQNDLEDQKDLEHIEILTLEHYLELKAQGFQFEGQSYLFWEYMRILTDIRKYNPDVYFLLENVMMKEKWKSILTRAIGIHPIDINAALVSAQNRERLFWTNIYAEPDGLFGDIACKIPQPKDKGILLRDILERDVDRKYYLSDKMLRFLEDKHCKVLDENGKSRTFTAGGNSTGLHSQMDLIDAEEFEAFKSQDKKSYCITKNYYRGISLKDHIDKKKTQLVYQEKKNYVQWDTNGLGNKSQDQRAFYEDGKCGTLGGDTPKPKVLLNEPTQLGNIYNEETNPQAGRVYDADGKSVTLKSEGGGGGAKTGLYLVGNIEGGGYESNSRVYSSDGKSKTLNAGNNGGGEGGQRTGIYFHNNTIRRLTPTECERLQTVSDGYTEGVSDTARYRMLGNGWCVDVIVHIFSYLPYPKIKKE